MGYENFYDLMVKVDDEQCLPLPRQSTSRATLTSILNAEYVGTLEYFLACIEKSLL